MHNLFNRTAYGCAPGLIIRGQRALVVRNRHKVPPQLGLPKHHTQVLFIEGPCWIINPRYLTQYLESRGIRFQVERIVDLPSRNLNRPDLQRLEFRYARYIEQARLTSGSLRREGKFKGLSPPICVDFDDDPCDVRFLGRHPDTQEQEQDFEVYSQAAARFPTYRL